MPSAESRREFGIGADDCVSSRASVSRAVARRPRLAQRGSGLGLGPRHRVPGTLASMLSAYREYRPLVGLEAVVVCVWEHEPAEDRAQRVVPDGAWT